MIYLKLLLIFVKNHVHLLKNSTTPQLDLRVIMCHFLNLTEASLITLDWLEIKKKDKIKILEAIKKRANHYPLAYITQKKEFYKRNFFVNEDVLIPRPETEELVENIINYINTRSPKVPLKILDLGTGSGVIAITLKLENPNLEVYAGDISKKALKVAKKNAKKHQAEINFFATDLLNQTGIADIPSKFDIIIANLPYVAQKFKNNSIKFEPEIALFSGEDGLDHYRSLSLQVSLNNCNTLFLEIDPRQEKSIYEIFSKAKKIRVRKDLAKMNRIIQIFFS